MILQELNIRIPREGDIWLVHYPYITPGNMEKIRPAIIIEILEESNEVLVQKLKGKELMLIPILMFILVHHIANTKGEVTIFRTITTWVSTWNTIIN